MVFNKYQVIKNAVSYELANFIFKYFLLKRDAVFFMYKNIHKPNAPKGTKVLLNVGDMLVYSGCELEHWREPFKGNTCGQVFLHYNHVNGPFADTNKFDGRPLLGLPKI